MKKYVETKMSVALNKMSLIFFPEDFLRSGV